MGRSKALSTNATFCFSSATGVVIPFIELIAGGFVILGLRTREALVSLGFVLTIVTFGHLLKEPLYEFHTHVIPRLALLLFIL